jgi:amidase
MIRITRDQIVYSFSRHHPPVATIESGTEVYFETWDARTGSIRSEQDTLAQPHPKGPNPATGPILVRGAEPGDSLAVEILDIQAAARGFTAIRPKMGVLGHLV